jgi:hypothetical protein
MTGSVVLTVNQVVDILLRWLELRDWQKACEAAVPLRKRVCGPAPVGPGPSTKRDRAGMENEDRD